MSIYRRIYEQHYGEIPKDAEGRSYEIHHIDGNHQNNDISNLKCVSIREHYDIHYSQKDWAACRIIAVRIKDLSNLSELTTNMNRERLENGSHNFLGKSNPTHKRIKEGSFHFLGGEIQKTKIKEGTHNFIGESNPVYNQLKTGTHPFKNQKQIKCPHCDKIGANSNMKRWHFDNCEFKKT